MKKIITSALIASTLAMAGGDIAPVVEEMEVTPAVESDWQQRISIYGWLPDLSGSINYDIPGSEEGIAVDASQLMDALEMVFMANYEARKGKWSFMADAIYLDLGNTESTTFTPTTPGPGNPQFDANADLSMSAWVLGLVGGYNMVQTDNLTLDLLAGARYLSLDVGADLQIDGPLPPVLPGRSLDQSAELWDAVVGFKGQYRFNENWFMPYYFDIGAGDSDLTWQALAGIGYSYGWGDVLLVYKHLSYDQGESGLVQDLELTGPAIAVSFRF